MKRPLTLFERGLYLDGIKPVSAVLPVKIRGTVDEDSLRKALLRIQAKHPILRSLIGDEDGRPWFVWQEHAPPIPLHIVERKSDNDWQALAWDAVHQLFDGRRQPLARMIWLRGEGVSELLLVCHHCICDGRSIVTLLSEILQLCDQPDDDIGNELSLNAFEDLFPEEVLRDRRIQRRTRLKAALFKLFILTRRRGPARVYGETYQLQWVFEPAVTQHLFERCKAEGVTFFAAASVAFMLAFRRVLGPRGVDKFVAPVDARRFLPALKADALFAIAPTVDMALDKACFEASAGADFWGLARAFKRDLATKIASMSRKVYETFLGMEHLHGWFDRIIASSQSGHGGRDVRLSYLGRVELAQDYRQFRVETMHCLSAMLAPTPAHLIAMSSFAGRLNFTFVSDELSLPREQASIIKEKAMALLLAAVPAEIFNEPALADVPVPMRAEAV
ncbi:condensation domain-containing protein [Dyella silvatica]|uniref:condensation domain-containing protein n=1 Tax=Dyella silvatica TaxID=2992128 RepID=UPI00225A29C2|nr:condensation domain-containing protein [Dyella silvatica]